MVCHWDLNKLCLCVQSIVPVMSSNEAVGEEVGQRILRIFLYPPLNCGIISTHQHTHVFLPGFWGLNCNSCSCIARTLPTKSYPQPLLILLDQGTETQEKEDANTLHLERLFPFARMSMLSQWELVND